MQKNQWNLPAVSDWAKHHPCTPRHAWRPCACGRPHTSSTAHPSAASVQGSFGGPLALLVIRTWALRALLLAALCITARALYTDAVCLYSHRGGGVTTRTTTMDPPATLPDPGIGKYARLVGVQAEALDGVLTAGVPLGVLAHAMGGAQAAGRVETSRFHVQDTEAHYCAPAPVDAAQEAADTLHALHAEIGVVVDRAIKSHALTHFALQRTVRRSPRHAAHLLRRAERALRADLADATQRISALAGTAFKALDALDERAAEMYSASAADALAGVCLRALDTQRSDARRAVQAVARTLREAHAAAQGVDADTDEDIPFSAGPQYVLWGHLERLRASKAQWRSGE